MVCRHFVHAFVQRMPTHLTDLTVGSICKTTSYGPRQITSTGLCRMSYALHLISALLVGGPTLHHITGPDGLPKRSEPQCKSSTYDVFSRTRTCVTLFRVTMGPCLRHPGYQATRAVCFLNNVICRYILRLHGSCCGVTSSLQHLPCIIKAQLRHPLLLVP